MTVEGYTAHPVSRISCKVHFHHTGIRFSIQRPRDKVCGTHTLTFLALHCWQPLRDLW